MRQAVCFDLGGTLVDRSRPRDLRTYWSGRGVHLRQRDAEAVLYRVDRMFMEHHPDLWRRAARDFQRRYWGLVHAELGLVAPPEAVCAAWGGPWNVYPDAWTALRQLRAAGCRLALISNWDDTAGQVLRATGLYGYFEVVAVSTEVGWEKPAPEIFAWTAARLGLDPRACVHVGDNCWDDVLGAREAGMKPVLVHRHPEWHALPALPAEASVVRDLACAVPYLLRPVEGAGVPLPV